ncbi:amidase family protein [Pseudaminobacter soli (ex Li et al. 2025)]|uniref:Amidase domain-containing protein n=1 Tax=Pseudaminobacter soli (ex Li et al. 2025) TaxID=1295366 RepID=A0A2P7S2Z6_9HYPH|nr:amidase [Mesorhizobium soli]PSJ56850.1 hypothetical protein C7I85_23480 [Mesorhizobium soli]
MFFDGPLAAIAEHAARHPDTLRDHYARLFDDIGRRDGKLRSLCDPTWEWLEGELNRISALLASGGGTGLAGVPIGVKDTIVVPGLPTQAGTQHDLGRILSLPPSPAVIALQQAGAVIVGKQATHQFGSSAGPAHTQSVRGADYFAGGSTVGGAVAVAAGFTHVALGTDGGGSVRKPAALAGVAGLRPRKGSISDEGQVNGTVFGQSTGLIAPSAQDIAMVLKRCPSLLTAPSNDLSSSRGNPTIGVPDISWMNVDAAVAATLRASAGWLARMGYKIVPTSLWYTEEAKRDFFLVVSFDNWMFHKPLMVEHSEIYRPDVARVMRMGEMIEPHEADAARYRLTEHRARFLDAAASEGLDMLLVPSVPWPDSHKNSASFQDLSAEAGRFGIIANIYDFDSFSVPVERDQTGRVLSVMLLALSSPLSQLLECALHVESRPPSAPSWFVRSRR